VSEKNDTRGGSVMGRLSVPHASHPRKAGGAAACGGAPRGCTLPRGDPRPARTTAGTAGAGGEASMIGRAWLGVVLVAVAVGGPAAAAAQEPDSRQVARELAHLMREDATRRSVADQVAAGMMQAMAATLQERLNRRLLDLEVRMLGGIVERFVAETLPPSRTEEIAVDIYLRHYDPDELRELLRFQQSAVGRKTARLAPAIAADFARAMDSEIRTSPALPRMLRELHGAFPVLGPPESP
jgi:hypothetical protein